MLLHKTNNMVYLSDETKTLWKKYFMHTCKQYYLEIILYYVFLV